MATRQRFFCECVGCNNRADRNVGGRSVCDQCYLRDDHLYFPWPKRKSFWERHPNIRAALYILLFAYIIGGAISFAIVMWPKVD